MPRFWKKDVIILLPRRIHKRHAELVSPLVTDVPASIVQHIQTQKGEMDPETSSG
jgi:hypothetical protein